MAYSKWRFRKKKENRLAGCIMGLFLLPLLIPIGIIYLIIKHPIIFLVLLAIGFIAEYSKQLMAVLSIFILFLAVCIICLLLPLPIFSNLKEEIFNRLRPDRHEEDADGEEEIDIIADSKVKMARKSTDIDKDRIEAYARYCNASLEHEEEMREYMEYYNIKDTGEEGRD